MASPEFEKLKTFMAENPMPKLGLDEMRAQMDAFGARAKLPEGVTVEVPGDTPVSARLYRPEGAGEGLVLFAHGGGFTMGSAASHGHVAGWLAAAAGVPVLIFDYRLAPEHPFPAALDDFAAVLAWALALQPASRIALAGDSAGACLSLALAATPGTAQVAAIVGLSPSTDLRAYLQIDPTQNPDKTVDAGAIADGFRAYIGGADSANPRISPNYADLSRLPPTLIQTAEGEVFAPGALDLAARAQAAGAMVEVDIWPEMMHDWHWFAPRLPEAREALGRAGAFIARHLG